MSTYEVPISFVVDDRFTPAMERFQPVLRAKARWLHEQWYCHLCAEMFSGPGVAARAIIMVK